MIKWCNICNSRPAVGVLEMRSKSDQMLMPYDACQECVDDIQAGKVDWVEWQMSGW